MHGIRTNAYGWVRKLAERLEQPTAAEATILVVHPSYGYLPAFNFALPFGHDRQLRAFADWYTQTRARHPRAPFHFVGHSNGTYIFGHSLRRIPSMTFENVYLGGSVLPRTYPWNHRSQVKNLVNVCGSRDIPVGILCSALRGVGRRDVGVGGYAGFDNPPPLTRQWVNIDGGHAAPFDDRRLDEVASYIRSGTPPTAQDLPASSKGLTRSQRRALSNRWLIVPSSYVFGFASRLVKVLAPWVLIGSLVGLALLFLTDTTAAAIVVGSTVVAVTLLRAM